MQVALLCFYALARIYFVMLTCKDGVFKHVSRKEADRAERLCKPPFQMRIQAPFNGLSFELDHLDQDACGKGPSA